MRAHRLTLVFTMALATSFLWSCSTGGTSVSRTHVPPGSEQAELLIVRVGIVDGPMLPGAEVLLVASSGMELQGVTDSLGVVKIPAAKLAAQGSYALLVCAENFHCGALRIDEPRFLELHERFIALAPFSIH